MSSNFLLLVAPCRRVTVRGGTFIAPANAFIAASVARPESGGSTTRITSAPPYSPPTAVVEEFGRTWTSTRTTAVCSTEEPVHFMRPLTSCGRSLHAAAHCRQPRRDLSGAVASTTVESNRLEAFSDAVVAILITIMVLELKIPHGASIKALRPLVTIGLTYVLSFANLGIYWNNHHHLLQLTDRVNGKVLWANLHLLFWLSLFPVATGWMGLNGFAKVPTAGYGVVLLLAGVAYYVLQTTIIAAQGPDSRLKQAIDSDIKGKISPVVYATAIPLAFLNRWIAIALYVLVAIMWFVPDRRLERAVEQPGPSQR